MTIQSTGDGGKGRGLARGLPRPAMVATGRGNGNGRRRLCIYQSYAHYIAGRPPVNVSWVRSDTAGEYLDRMLPGEWAALWETDGRLIDTATAATH